MSLFKPKVILNGPFPLKAIFTFTLEPLGQIIRIKIFYDDINSKFIFVEPGLYVAWKKEEKIPEFVKLKVGKNIQKLVKFIKSFCSQL